MSNHLAEELLHVSQKLEILSDSYKRMISAYHDFIVSCQEESLVFNILYKKQLDKLNETLAKESELVKVWNIT